VLLDRTVGHLTGTLPGQPEGSPLVVATPDSLFCLFSASKLLCATLAHKLLERRLLHLDDRVVRFIPDFGRHGKDAITVRHLLEHTAGIHTLPRLENPESLADRALLLDMLCDLKPVSPPGQRHGYHPVSAFFLLGEVLERVAGADVGTLLRRELLDPLGIDQLDYGVGPEDDARVGLHAFTGWPVPGMAAKIFADTVGLLVPQAIEISNSEPFRRGVLPPVNAYGTARDTARFFEMLVNGGELDGVRVLEERTVAAATRVRSGHRFDETLQYPQRYARGFMAGGRFFSLYGLPTPRAFGHLGFTTVVVWADPERELSVALLNTGKCFFAPGMLHWVRLIQNIAQRIPRTGRRRPRPTFITSGLSGPV